jgi:5-methylthioadenosine/S-adenosylhomocysteine deaminase
MTRLLIAGGEVLMSSMELLRADIVIDQDTGLIEAIGPTVGETFAIDRRLDATDAVVMPGLVNAHTHAAMTLFRGLADDKPLDRWLREDIWPIEAHLDAPAVRAGTELAVVEMIRSGTTCFADMYFFMPTVAEVVDAWGMRAKLGRGVVTVGKDEAAATDDIEASLSFAREYAGAADGRIQTAFMPHSLTTVAPEMLAWAVPAARDAGVDIHYHANETTAEVTPIREREGVVPLEYAAAQGMLEAGDFIAHGVHLDAAEIALLADAHVGVIHCPASNMKLASGMAPIQQLVDAGATVGLGTDGAASNNDLDMFGEMRDAAMIGKLAAGDAAAMDAPSVLEIATIGGAVALGMPGGLIEVGAAADLAVVDLDAPHLVPRHDIVSHLVYAACGRDVRHTICDGQVLMQDRRIPDRDVTGVCETAEARAIELVEMAR